MAAGMLALGDVGLALSSWFFVCLWAALMGLGTEIEETESEMGWESRTENLFSLHNDSVGMVALCLIFLPLGLYLGG